ncbi:hypothetical protein N0B44_03000 [Roseibacterium beibuensis]|uniref:Uncharacterized protein n=1 Tax=[Roseibacterium] beibuensis TaxID=1193142 RepID=A0ABP9L024_9RHOB|nr:hypothetical protein [Roseibacterium beibuensis]MCS6621874.1 hypothetical protein [Roseibacterium beibuensis]
MTTGAAILSTSFGLSGLILGTFLSSGRLGQALGVLLPMPVGLAIGAVSGWARSREGRG